MQPPRCSGLSAEHLRHLRVIIRMSKIYSLKTVQKIPVSLAEAWDFFSRPENLQHITPPSMRFTIVSTNHGEKMFAGQIIEYKVHPILGIPLYWMTEITHVSEQKYFIDEQRFGPYKLWHHQHHFRETEGGVEMTDLVHYKLPFWFVGDWANTLLVEKQLKEIFAYRKVAVEKRFPF